MAQFKLKKSLLGDMILVYSIQGAINLFNDDKEEQRYYIEEMKELTEKLECQGVSIELIKAVQEKADNHFLNGYDGYLYDMVVSCGVELI